MTDEQDSSKGKRRRKKGSKSKKPTMKDISIVGLFGITLLIILAFSSYFVMAWGAMLFPINSSYKPVSKGITIYVHSNGFHTEFIVPLKNEETHTNWLAKVGDSTLTAKYDTYEYAALGWGDDGFYMDSYDNNFPSAPTIFSALFIPTTTLMHVTFYPKILSKDNDMATLVVSPQQYKDLVNYIEKSFKKDIDNKFIPKNAVGYYKHDYFFHANGYYHLFSTCNDWTNAGLKTMGIKTSRKAPFASGVMYHLK